MLAWESDASKVRAFIDGMTRVAVTVPQIIESTGMNRRTVDNVLRNAMQSGKLERLDRGVYRRTESSLTESAPAVKKNDDPWFLAGECSFCERIERKEKIHLVTSPNGCSRLMCGHCEEKLKGKGNGDGNGKEIGDAAPGFLGNGVHT